MASVTIIFSNIISAPISLQAIVGAVVLGLIYYIVTGERPYTGLPVVTIPSKGWDRLLPPKFAWVRHAEQILAKGTAECSGAFQVLTSSGYKIVVPNRFANDLKAHPGLNFNEAFAKDFPVHYPGFDGMRQGLQDGTFMQEVVRVKLTQSLGLVTEDLVDETAAALHDIFGESSEWHVRPMKQDVLDIVARLSSRVFLGKELCRNKEWLQISKDYTIDTFLSANLLRMCPGLLRPMLYWFIPSCTKLRREVRDSRSLILPEVERRRKRAEAALEVGEKPPKAADTIGWMVEVSKGRSVDYVAAQLALTTAAIHTTAETTTKAILQLCETPEVVQPLREEMIQVLSGEGWSKVSLYKMKLLDSFLREVQRTHGLASTSMNRLVKAPITLSDGTTLPTGSRIMIADDKVYDSSVYEEPRKFDVARFLRLRQHPGEENRHQFVTTSPEHMAFGHGQHACPGRFFASNEMKIALCFLLLKYDVRFVPGEGRPKDLAFESASMTAPKLQVQIRRRQEEVDLAKPTGKDEEVEQDVTMK